MQEQLEDMLDEIGIPAHFKGYQYWIDIVILAYNDNPNNYSYNMEYLYIKVSKKYNTSRDCIERCCRYAKSFVKLDGPNIKSCKNFLAELVKMYKRRYKNEI